MERQTKRTAAKPAATKPKAAPKRAPKADKAVKAKAPEAKRAKPAPKATAPKGAAPKPAVDKAGLPNRKAPAKKKTAKGASEASDALLKVVQRSLDDDQAVDIAVIDLAGKTSIADYLVVASGRSTRQVGAMAEHLSKRIKTEGFGRPHLEGMPQNDWVLVDAGDVIVHLFRPEVRTFYNLEKMWSAEFDPEAEAATGS